MEVKIVEYSRTAAALGELRQRYENVLFPVNTTAGMKDAVEARRELRDLRVGLEKMRKEIKAPALERCRLIDEEAKTITAQLVTLEDPIDAQIKAEETRKAAEKAERERKERERVAAIRSQIDAIRNLPASMAGETADELAVEIAALDQYTPGQEFAEFQAEAEAARIAAVETLRAMHQREAERAAEAARVAAERAELERQRQEQAERERQAAAEREAIEAKLRAEREELARMRAEIEAAKNVAPVEPAPAAPEPDHDMLADAATCGMAITMMEFDAEAGAVTATPVPLKDVLNTPSAPAPAKRATRPSDDEIIDALALHFRVHESKVIEWLADMDLHAAGERLVEAF